MEITLLLCGLAVGVLACTWVAQRLDVPAPFLLIVVGIAASYVPVIPDMLCRSRLMDSLSAYQRGVVAAGQRVA